MTSFLLSEWDLTTPKSVLTCRAHQLRVARDVIVRTLSDPFVPQDCAVISTSRRLSPRRTYHIVHIAEGVHTDMSSVRVRPGG